MDFKVGDWVKIDAALKIGDRGHIAEIRETGDLISARVTIVGQPKRYIWININNLQSFESNFTNKSKELVTAKIKSMSDEAAIKTDGGGKRFNEGKPRVELLVPEAMIEEAKVWAFGAKKYGDHNWTRGMAWSKVIACILRHTFAIMRGEDTDPESGCLHAAHIKCNASMLIWYAENYKQGDDRNKINKDE